MQRRAKRSDWNCFVGVLMMWREIASVYERAELFGVGVEMAAARC